MTAKSCATPDEFAALARRFLDVHAHTSTPDLVRNIDARVECFDFNGLPLPVTVNHAGRDNAWVCSPQTTYTRYAIEETRRVLHRSLAWPLCALIGIADRWLLRSGFDNAVSINNWLLSTNLYPHAEGIDFRAMRNALESRWPAHAIWFRSLNRVQQPQWIDGLVQAGFELIPSRQVYVFHDVSKRAAQPQNLRRDLALLKRTSLVQVDGTAFTDRDFLACERLYSMLYLDKYSRLNPQYTALFLKTWTSAGLLELTGFRDHTGHLCAVVGTYAQGSQLTAPIVGYDTTMPQSAGLYRLLMAHVLKTAAERTGLLNLSAGAAHFKRLRGGQAVIEYSAVYCDHLPLASRRAIRYLRMLTQHIGVPVMTRFQL